MADFNAGREPVTTDGEVDGEAVVFVELTKGQRAIVDAGVWPRVVSEYGRRWSACRTPKGGYSARKELRRDGRRQAVTLARAVMQPAPGVLVYAINGNACDCRRSNLEVAARRPRKNGETVKPSRRASAPKRTACKAVRRSGKRHAGGRMAAHSGPRERAAQERASILPEPSNRPRPRSRMLRGAPDMTTRSRIEVPRAKAKTSEPQQDYVDGLLREHSSEEIKAMIRRRTKSENG